MIRPLHSLTTHRPFTAAAFCAAGLLAQPQAQGQVIGATDDDEAGVPHIVVSGDAGSPLTLGFEAVTPSSLSTLNALFPQFTSVFDTAPGVPTLIISVPGGSVVPTPGGDVAEFISNPVSGISPSEISPGVPNLLNDDNGFESEDLATGSDITVTFSPAAINSDAFFIILGSDIVTNINPDAGVGTPPVFVEDELFTGSNFVDAFSLGEVFDDHPLFGLQAPADEINSFVGSALIDVTVTDANDVLAGDQSFRFLITNDSAAFVVPEPASAALLAALVPLALGRRRRRA